MWARWAQLNCSALAWRKVLSEQCSREKSHGSLYRTYVLLAQFHASIAVGVRDLGSFAQRASDIAVDETQDWDRAKRDGDDGARNR